MADRTLLSDADRGRLNALAEGYEKLVDQGDSRYAKEYQQNAELLRRLASSQLAVSGPTNALQRIHYWATVNYEDSGEMATAVDRIADLAKEALAGQPTNSSGVEEALEQKLITRIGDFKWGRGWRTMDAAPERVTAEREEEAGRLLAAILLTLAQHDDSLKSPGEEDAEGERDAAEEVANELALEAVRERAVLTGAIAEFGGRAEGHRAALEDNSGGPNEYAAHRHRADAFAEVAEHLQAELDRLDAALTQPVSEPREGER